MKLKKEISKILIIGILINNLSILSHARTLSPDTRYEIFEGTDITISDILEEDRADVEIEGNTIVNLCGDIIDKDSSASVNNNLIVFENPKNASVSFRLNNIKPLTTYTVIVRTQNLSYPVRTEIFLDSLQQLNTITKSNITDKKVFTTPKNISDSVNFRYYVSMTRSGISSLEKPIILEGDWTDMEIPDYFEGMKSVGQDDKNGHKIEIISQVNENTFSSKTTFSNLVNSNSILRASDTPNGFKVIGESGKSNGSMRIHNVIKNNGDWTMSGYIKSSINQVVKFDVCDVVMKTVQATTDWTKFEFTHKVTNHNNTFNFIDINELNNSEILFKDIKIERGTKATKWTPAFVDNPNNIYLDKKEILLNEPLRAIPNGVKDKVIKKNGKWVVERNCGIRPYQESDKDNPNVITDKVNTIYKLSSPIYEPLNVDSTLKLFEDTTHISNNSTVPANMRVIVDGLLSIAIDATDKAVILETIESISTARTWVNMLPESIIKDELQSKLNNIFNISELNKIEIEKKNITANTDIYIQPINTLVMSLSTNSITFDEFSGAENLELKNALNIFISSSLPYNLNASLPTDIYNSNKTDSLPKNIINIKEDSNRDYKAFSNLNDKIILKENNPSGNNIKHIVDLMLSGGITHKKDVYKAVIKFEAVQQ